MHTISSVILPLLYTNSNHGNYTGIVVLVAIAHKFRFFRTIRQGYS